MTEALAPSQARLTTELEADHPSNNGADTSADEKTREAGIVTMATVTFDLHAEVAPGEEADAGANPLEKMLSSSSARAWVLLQLTSGLQRDWRFPDPRNRLLQQPSGCGPGGIGKRWAGSGDERDNQRDRCDSTNHGALLLPMCRRWRGELTCSPQESHRFRVSLWPLLQRGSFRER
jgi:hypothetical protein